jgi:hypothetical protein
MFFECYNVATGETSRPRGWGVKVGDEYKMELLAAGWHAKPCSGEEEEEEEDGDGELEGELEEDGVEEEGGGAHLDPEDVGKRNRQFSSNKMTGAKKFGNQESCRKDRRSEHQRSFGIARLRHSHAPAVSISHHA